MKFMNRAATASILLFILCLQVSVGHAQGRPEAILPDIGQGTCFKLANFDGLGPKYVVIRDCWGTPSGPNSIQIYDSQRSSVSLSDGRYRLFKEIRVHEIENTSGYVSVASVSNHTFNLDDKIEFLLAISGPGWTMYHLYNEDGQLLARYGDTDSRIMDFELLKVGDRVKLRLEKRYDDGLPTASSEYLFYSLPIGAVMP